MHIKSLCVRHTSLIQKLFITLCWFLQVCIILSFNVPTTNRSSSNYFGMCWSEVTTANRKLMIHQLLNSKYLWWCKETIFLTLSQSALLLLFSLHGSKKVICLIQFIYLILHWANQNNHQYKQYKRDDLQSGKHNFFWEIGK